MNDTSKNQKPFRKRQYESDSEKLEIRVSILEDRLRKAETSIAVNKLTLRIFWGIIAGAGVVLLAVVQVGIQFLLRTMDGN